MNVVLLEAFNLKKESKTAEIFSPKTLFLDTKELQVCLLRDALTCFSFDLS